MMNDRKARLAWVRRATAAAAMLSLLALGPGAALAHAKLKSASPAANAKVKSGLSEVSLKFNEAVEPALSVVELLDAEGKTLATSSGKPICEKTSCVWHIDPLKPGSYSIRYHVLSQDGHVVEASYNFTVVN